ncbi:uncharacterized protein ARMOST_13306 [Armillaria ostoyae]|uniref:Uncharacterized protein n=1 Tax=Armillaria ostoyae TaxID=47428 RepID=A0A284RMH8_ARMOS|nr:uncharacterized protein ARMOST_13306 [Armillaria ostoyae]
MFKAEPVKQPFEIPPSQHDPIRCITNPRRHTLNPSKISWDSAQDYGADQTLTRPTSPHTPAKMVRQRRNSIADTPALIVSKKLRRATACCCSCHCPYTTPKHSVNSELNVIHAAPPSPLDPSFPPYTEGDDIFGPTLETPLRSLRKRKSKLPPRPASEYSFPRIYSKDHFYQHTRKHSGDSFGSVKRKLKRHFSRRILSQVLDDREPSIVPSKIAPCESRHLRRTTRRIMSTPMNLVEPPSSLDHRQTSTQFQQVHHSCSQPRISGSFEIDLSPILEDTPVFGNVTSVLAVDEKEEEVGSVFQPSFILKSISCQALEDQSDLPSGYPPIPSLMLTFPTPVLPSSPVFSPPPCGNAALSVHSIAVGHSEPTFLCDSCELTLDLRFSHEEVNTWQRWTTLSRKKFVTTRFWNSLSRFKSTPNEDMAWISKTSKEYDILALAPPNVAFALLAFLRLIYKPYLCSAKIEELELVSLFFRLASCSSRLYNLRWSALCWAV